MLRISITTYPHATTVVLEGRVVGAWADELSACWQNLKIANARPIQVELDGVTFVDDAGKILLQAMHADGAILAASTVMMRAVVEEIAAPKHVGSGQTPTRSAQR